MKMKRNRYDNHKSTCNQMIDFLNDFADSVNPYEAPEDALKKKNSETTRYIIYFVMSHGIRETPYMKEKRTLMSYNTGIDFASSNVNATLQTFLDNWNVCSHTNLMYSYLKEAIKSIENECKSVCR